MPPKLVPTHQPSFGSRRSPSAPLSHWNGLSYWILREIANKNVVIYFASQVGGFYFSNGTKSQYILMMKSRTKKRLNIFLQWINSINAKVKWTHGLLSNNAIYSQKHFILSRLKFGTELQIHDIMHTHYYWEQCRQQNVKPTKKSHKWNKWDTAFERTQQQQRKKEENSPVADS